MAVLYTCPARVWGLGLSMCMGFMCVCVLIQVRVQCLLNQLNCVGQRSVFGATQLVGCLCLELDECVVQFF